MCSSRRGGPPLPHQPGHQQSAERKPEGGGPSLSYRASHLNAAWWSVTRGPTGREPPSAPRSFSLERPPEGPPMEHRSLAGFYCLTLERGHGHRGSPGPVAGMPLHGTVVHRHSLHRAEELGAVTFLSPAREICQDPNSLAQHVCRAQVYPPGKDNFLCEEG